MPHITEGLLHAHLDGALGPDEQPEWAKAERHLEVCDDCRRRLDEAAELRDTASALLAAAAPAPSSARPEFAELVARAEARRVEPSPGGGRSVGVGRSWWRTPAKLAWAASLVIAVGAGWIGRQLVVEDGLDGPRVSAEQDATVGEAGAAEGATLEDTRDGAVPDETRARGDAAPAAAPESVSQFRADEGAQARRAVRPETDEAQEKVEARSEGEADAIRLQATTLAVHAARCYARSPEAHDDREAETAGGLEALRLSADGTAGLRLDGRPMVGFWERAEADSLRLRVTDGEAWQELVLIEAGGGVRGAAELEAVACP